MLALLLYWCPPLVRFVLFCKASLAPGVKVMAAVVED